MKVLIALLSLVAVGLSQVQAQANDGFDPNAYVQVEVIFFSTEAAAGATNRTGVRAEMLELDGLRMFPRRLLSIENARLAKDWNTSWFEDEWSLIAPRLRDVFPQPVLPEEAVEPERRTIPDAIPEVPQDPTLWQRYQAWYNDVLASCFAQRDRAEWHLARALAALERSSAHQVLMHGAWIQPVSTQRRPIMLSGGERGEVGFLSVTRQGFFEAEVRVWRPLGDGHAELHELRAMRSRRANYFDHPLMGVVLRVDPIRVPSEFR